MMTNRRTLLRALLFLIPLTVLVSACRHGSLYVQEEEPERQGGGY